MMIVPDKTIAFIPVLPETGLKQFDMNISTFLNPLNKNHTRDWFTPNFYRCLPLSIGNMQGFVFSSPFSFDVMWNGKVGLNAISINIHNDADFDMSQMHHVSLGSIFGHGIFTFTLPVILKTPPGVNLMTISPPNYPINNISPMTGVVETDNLRFTFTLNFKINTPNTLIKIQKNYPIMGILPIPRYFCDSFSLVNAYDIIDHDLINKEQEISKNHANQRKNYNQDHTGPDGLYYKGMDFDNNKFNDHQLPRKQK